MASSSRPLNILIVDDNEAFRASLRVYINDALPDSNIRELTSDSQSPRGLIDRAIRSDVVFVDHRLGKLDGVKLVRALKTANPR